MFFFSVCFILFLSMETSRISFYIIYFILPYRLSLLWNAGYGVWTYF